MFCDLSFIPNSFVQLIGQIYNADFKFTKLFLLLP